MFRALMDNYKKWKDRCRSCEVDFISNELVQRFPNLIYNGKVKDSIEYICNRCNTLWIMPLGSKMVSKVARKAIYEKWKIEKNYPNEQQMAILNSIIGVPDYYSVNIFYPCSVTFNGKTFEKTIITATLGGVFGKFPSDREVYALCSAHLISESKFAVPYDIRLASIQANEISMGFAPINVKDKAGVKYTFHNQIFFVDEKSVVGKDLIIDNEKSHRKNMLYSDWADLYLFCDQFNDFYKMKAAQPNAARDATHP